MEYATFFKVLEEAFSLAEPRGKQSPGRLIGNVPLCRGAEVWRSSCARGAIIQRQEYWISDVHPSVRIPLTASPSRTLWTHAKSHVASTLRGYTRTMGEATKLLRHDFCYRKCRADNIRIIKPPDCARFLDYSIEGLNKLWPSTSSSRVRSATLKTSRLRTKLARKVD